MDKGIHTCQHTHTHTVCMSSMHTYTNEAGVTYNSELRVGVDLAVLIPSHTLVHSRVGQGQAAD